MWPSTDDVYQSFPLLVDRAGYRVEELPLPQHPQRLLAPCVASRDLPLQTPRPAGHVFPVAVYQQTAALLRHDRRRPAGGVILLVLAVQNIGGQPLADRPMLLLGVLLLALGVKAVALGPIGEMIVFLFARDMPPYRLARQWEPEPEDPRAADPESPTVGAVGPP
jgi:hypothetical protein